MNSQYEKSQSRHFVGLSMVVGLHILVAYAVITGSAQKYFAMKEVATVTKIVEQKPPPPPELPPLKEIQQKWTPPIAPYVPVPEINIAHDAPPVFAHVTQAAPESKAPPVFVKPQQIEEGERTGPGIIGPVLITDGCEELDYPWVARKERQEGAVLLLLLIDVNGKALQSKVAGSSGFPVLDEAARAGIAACRFKPGTEFGVPKLFWKKLRYVWDLPF